jgi:hypothetical protein
MVTRMCNRNKAAPKTTLPSPGVKKRNDCTESDQGGCGKHKADERFVGARLNGEW